MDSIWGKAKSSVPRAWSYFQRSSLVHLLKAGLRVCMMPFSLGVPAKKSGLTSRNFQGKRSSGYKQVIFRVVLGLREVQRCACFDQQIWLPLDLSNQFGGQRGAAGGHMNKLVAEGKYIYIYISAPQIWGSAAPGR